MKQFISVLLVLILVSCGNEEQHDLTVKGHIKGLKKGSVYLQKQQDTLMITIDSLEINGNPNFELHAELTEPEILFLKLDKNDDEEGTVAFFADKGITEINSTLKNFNFDAVVKGSKQQEILNEYLIMMSKFNNRNLDLIKENFESQKEKDTVKTKALQTNFDNLLKQKYLYTINFAVNHPDSEVSPYLAISEIPNTSISFLQQIYDALTEQVKSSKYGIQLKDYIEELKVEEAN